MAQVTAATLLEQGDRLGVRHAAGPRDSRPLDGVQIVDLQTLDALAAGTLAVLDPRGALAPYLLDVAIRQAIARGVPALVVVGDVDVAETASALALRGGVVVLVAPGADAPELAVAIDRLLAGGASDILTRSTYAIERATETAARLDADVDDVLAAAGQALGVDLELVDDPAASPIDNDVVCVGEVPLGRVVPATTDAAVAITLPVVAALASRTAQRSIRDRFAPTQSRADLIVELVLAEASRVDAFVGQAGRLGLPLHHAHAVGWLAPTDAAGHEGSPPRGVGPAVELFALQLVEARAEQWHVAFVRDDMLLVCTEESGAGDHQRRMREVAERVQQRAGELAGGDWVYTLGIGTPQQGAAGLRQSAAEARIAAETAIASSRQGEVALTDVTGLRRVLLDLYASPISRTLLADVLTPLDDLDPDRATTAARTLLAYLAHDRSLARAGRELTLHPNAVGYRLARIRERLQLDLDDPDTRFAVELACRVRLLGLAH